MMESQVSSDGARIPHLYRLFIQVAVVSVDFFAATRALCILSARPSIVRRGKRLDIFYLTFKTGIT